MSGNAIEEFLQRLESAVGSHTLHKLTFGNYHGIDKSLLKLSVKPVQVKGKEYFSFVYHHKTRDITKNHPVGDALQEARLLLKEGFRAAYLLDGAGEMELKITAKGSAHLRETGKTADTTATQNNREHDRKKKRTVDITRPWLQALGITDAHARVLPSMSHKWKQINRFVEVFSHALEQSGFAKSGKLRIRDFGSGKGYLTFAVADYLHSQGLAAEVTGVELREDLVALCNRTAAESGIAHLCFRSGDIRHAEVKPCDVVIALHACDTATDLALHYGIRARASVILCAPCCHKEIRPQLIRPPVLKPLLRHGVHASAEAEMLTDSLRGLLLERENYDVKIMEFISLEHTDKNRLLMAVQRTTPLNDSSRNRIKDELLSLKEFYGIRHQTLEALLDPTQ